jgi:hypothetical protein
MGRLAGYKYREIVKRLPRERFERSSDRPESKCTIS